jgi:hypothetical protein
MQLTTIDGKTLEKALTSGLAEQGDFCRDLERGQILFFPQSPVELPQKDQDFLLAQKQVDAAYHKNIAYRPQENRVTGLVKRTREDRERMLRIMGQFSSGVRKFLARLLVPYAPKWRMDYASFRPQEEQNRQLKTTSRNDLLHVDAFPTRPTNGDRILRFFVNINPEAPRLWVTADSFEVIFGKYGQESGLLPGLQPSSWRQMKRRVKRWGASLGLPVVDRSPYDEFMMGFHHYLKRNNRFQSTEGKYKWEFAPNSSWMVFTDQVPHAALSGQFALEQTLIISKDSLLLPGQAPLSVLEGSCGRQLA